MGFLTKNPTQSVNPNSPEMQALQGDFATFLQGIMQNPNLLSQGVSKTPTSDLQRQSLGGIQQFLNQPSPEVATFEKLSPGLMEMFNQDGQGLTNAMFPLFQRGLQEGLGGLANSGMGRFSTTFEKQGVDLTSRAVQDFNLLQQQAFQQNIGNRLNAAGLLGTLSGQAGQAPFNRLASAAGLGMQATGLDLQNKDLNLRAMASNPYLQLLLGGMNFASPAPNDTIVGKSWMDHLLGAGTAYAASRGGG